MLPKAIALPFVPAIGHELTFYYLTLDIWIVLFGIDIKYLRIAL